MPEHTTRLPATLLTVADDLEREFEARLTASATLAYRVAYSVLRQPQDAEDVAQEAFARAYRSFRWLRDRDRFRAWLVRMTWRLALNFRRSDRRRLVREAAEAPRSEFESASAALAGRERSEQVWRAIDALPEKLRVTIVLASIEGHDIGEVARLLRIPEGTVKSRLFLGRKQLKELLS